MSTFTTPFWKAIEYAGDNGLNDYPIFDEVYRESLNQRILEHYDEQEIGIESPIRFVFALRRKMHEIMPKYNKLYESDRLVIDPLNTVNMVRTNESHADTENTQNVQSDGVSDTIQDVVSNTQSNSTSTGETSGLEDTTTTSNTDNRARTTNSAMPQGRLGTNKDYATNGTDVVSGIDTDVANNTTNSTDSSSTSSDTGNSTTNDVGKATTTNTTDGVGTSQENSNSTDTEKGWNGNQSEMLLKYRETFLNIDLMVIQELGELFMLLWNTSDDYENKGGFGYGY